MQKAFIILILLIMTFVIIVYKNIVYKKNLECYDKNFVITTLVRGCARWASASLQDNSPLVAVLHANYASGYLWALRDVFSDTEIKNASGINIIQFQKHITDTQDTATKKLIHACPQYTKDIDKYLGKIAGES
jgi:hypothetical protein